MSFPFAKYQGAGNDFVVVQGDAVDWSGVAPRLCDRHRGAGADGLLVLLPSAVARFRMRMFNPDGTEDDCGNGLRCLALHAVLAGAVAGREFPVETLSGVKPVSVLELSDRSGWIQAGMGRAVLHPAAIPAEWPGSQIQDEPLPVGGEWLRLHSLSTGTAHTVLFDTPEEERFQRLSPLLERHPRFPERTSVLWTEVLDRERCRVRIWERGVGETLACGTGACAVAVAAYRAGRTGPRVRVLSRGGELHVRVADDLSLSLAGPAALVYRAVWGETPSYSAALRKAT